LARANDVPGETHWGRGVVNCAPHSVPSHMWMLVYKVGLKNERSLGEI